MKKQILREEMKVRKRSLNEDNIHEDSKVIINQLIQSDVYKNTNIIFTYVNFNQEVRTKEFIKQAMSDGKKVAVPKILGNDMEFIWIDGDSLYNSSNIGIDEPTNELIVKEDELVKEAIILNVVPGLAFDHNKNRVGYGKGYYDRYFTKHNSVKFYKVAITYDFQIVGHIEASPLDIKVDEIISKNHHIV